MLDPLHACHTLACVAHRFTGPSPQVEDSLHEVQMYLLLGSHDNIVALR